MYFNFSCALDLFSELPTETLPLDLHNYVITKVLSVSSALKFPKKVFAPMATWDAGKTFECRKVFWKYPTHTLRESMWD